MSILIRGMEMPKNCWECSLTNIDDDFGRCCLYSGIACLTIGRQDNCPLVDNPEPQWIPVTERLPDDLAEVIVTWINHIPEPYYDFLKNKPFTGVAVFYKEQWFWYSSTTVDVLAEYGRCGSEKIDDAIEIIAWMPIPEPWKGDRNGQSD